MYSKFFKKIPKLYYIFFFSVFIIPVKNKGNKQLSKYSSYQNPQVLSFNSEDISSNKSEIEFLSSDANSVNIDSSVVLCSESENTNKEKKQYKIIKKEITSNKKLPDCILKNNYMSRNSELITANKFGKDSFISRSDKKSIRCKERELNPSFVQKYLSNVISNDFAEENQPNNKILQIQNNIEYIESFNEFEEGNSFGYTFKEHLFSISKDSYSENMLEEFIYSVGTSRQKLELNDNPVESLGKIDEKQRIFSIVNSGSSKKSNIISKQNYRYNENKNSSENFSFDSTAEDSQGKKKSNDFSHKNIEYLESPINTFLQKNSISEKKVKEEEYDFNSKVQSLLLREELNISENKKTHLLKIKPVREEEYDFNSKVQSLLLGEELNISENKETHLLKIKPVREEDDEQELLGSNDLFINYLEKKTRELPLDLICDNNEQESYIKIDRMYKYLDYFKLNNNSLLEEKQIKEYGKNNSLIKINETYKYSDHSELNDNGLLEEKQIKEYEEKNKSLEEIKEMSESSSKSSRNDNKNYFCFFLKSENNNEILTLKTYLPGQEEHSVKESYILSSETIDFNNITIPKISDEYIKRYDEFFIKQNEFLFIIQKSTDDNISISTYELIKDYEDEVPSEKQTTECFQRNIKKNEIFIRFQ